MTKAHSSFCIIINDKVYDFALLKVLPNIQLAKWTLSIFLHTYITCIPANTMNFYYRHALKFLSCYLSIVVAMLCAHPVTTIFPTGFEGSVNRFTSTRTV